MRDLGDIEYKLGCYLPDSPDPLHQAMRYSVLNGGKRLRPSLVYAAGDLNSADPEKLHRAACAVEYIHAYSLIHDDLPSMDDDDFRRGKPSCHKAYGEAMAILAGDALQSLAFEVLAGTHEIKLIQILAKAIGPEGMVYGQSLDIKNLGDNENQEIIHLNKTAKLIIASVQLGYLCGDNFSRDNFQALTVFAENLGLAFQYQDDFFDGDLKNAEKAKNFYHKARVNLEEIKGPDIKPLENIIHQLQQREN